ncbi:MAG TPA: F0F1 ATP synthase subunit A [bacterium]
MEEAVEHAANGEGGGGHEGGNEHLFNIVHFASEALHQQWIADWINVIYSFLIMIMILIVFAMVAKNMQRIPGRFQNFIELLFGAFEGLVTDTLGHKNGRAFLPLIGTLFIYILIMNLNGLIPVIGHSPSASLNITLSLALFVFLTVHAHGIREMGLGGYLKHYAGWPSHGKPTGIDIALTPLMFPLHIIGELAKPVSLSLRLFGNITGEDVLIFIFVTLLGSTVVWFIPLQFFMYPIALLGNTIQATVFAMLSMIYILTMSHHGEEH